jgi:hypothetical protein
MRCTLTSLVLATLTVGQAAYAATVSHAHAHMHAHNAQRRADHVESVSRSSILTLGKPKTNTIPDRKRAAALSSVDSAKLISMGVNSALGVNSWAPTSNVWLGQGGPYQNELINNSGQDLIVVFWGVAGSWVNAVQPAITVSIPNNGTQWVSFASGASGAYTAVYPDTTMVNGQISNTWVEYTMGQYGVVDISREVNMNGHNMQIQGPNCVSNMNTCVFKCPPGQSVCTYGYILENCENGSQIGANYGTYAGAPSGGCGGMGASATLTTHFW